MAMLRATADMAIHVIDRSSPGLGWQGKHAGVGWARKLPMDAAAERAADKDIIVSIDADTHYPPHYLASLVQLFQQQPKLAGHSNPYFHPLGADPTANRAILRYELYMRLYLINLLRVGSPYAFTALGSAMAVRVSHYKKMGGMSPKRSGEDFYFLQKIVKTGQLSIWNEQCAYPEARFSDRVDFGTGPAMIKGRQGLWQSYPFYPPQLFDNIASSQKCYRALYETDVDFPLARYLAAKQPLHELWRKLRKNHGSAQAFQRACHEYIDGLRLLQYCKDSYKDMIQDDNKHLKDNLIALHQQGFDIADKLISAIRHEPISTETMAAIREQLFTIEQALRKQQKTLQIA